MSFSWNANEAQRTQGRKLVFAGLVLVIFGGVLVSGVRPAPVAAVSAQTARLQTGQPLDVRQDTALPTCDAREAIKGVQSQLVRSGTARIIGLSDIYEINYDGRWGRMCQAKVNMDFGTQPVDYSIRQLGQGAKTWELVLVAH